MRLRAGLDLLLNCSERTVAEIAYELRFASHAHFTTAFRGLFGVTPLSARTLGAVRKNLKAVAQRRP